MRNLFLLSFLLTSIGYSQTNSQFLKCVPSYQLEACTLANLEFFPKSSVELKFNVEYIDNCSGTPISLGVRDSSNNAFYQFSCGSGIQTTAFNGVGPVVSFDTTPGVTYTGGFNLACDIRVTGISTDISDNTREILNRTVELLKAFNLIIGKAKDIDSLAVAIETLITQIDVGSIKTLIMTLYNNTVALRDSYALEHKDETVEALNEVIVDIKMKICSNPPLRAGNERFCTGVEPIDPPPADPVKALAQSITSIRQASNDVIEVIKDQFSGNVVYAVGALAVAKADTKSDYMRKICGELDKASVHDNACEPYKP